jgi:hypothetical protein
MKLIGAGALMLFLFSDFIKIIFLNDQACHMHRLASQHDKRYQFV